MPGLNLSRFEAEGRSRVISSPKYSIYLDLTDKSNYFESITTIEFDAIFGTSTFVDLVSKRIDAITLNGRALDPNIYYQDYRIRLEDLQKQNRLTVRSLQQYSNQGEGLHKFVDPADGLTYLYSQFEVPDSRKVFAVFEQPDIKGTFTFTVVAPKTWEVISTQPTVSPKPATWIKHGEAQIFSFTKTPKLSSYVTSICAGPYKVFYDELTNTDGRTIPLRLMCRQSLAQHFDVETIFDITKKGFQFYGENFNFPYPYAKYDQIFVPEFNAGAMENAGTITYTDNYIFRSATAQPMYERRCVTILHELAHMWFGDLVTMKWWNDLWLNESFAEYMSTLATAEATVYQDIWTTFNIMEKTWAFGQDDLPTTHPIAADIKDLEDVQVNFDGITYAKGASTLKQFVEYVGRENFFEGLSQYLRKHAFANATLSDLISEIESASKRDLKSWCISWLESAGPNTLKPILTTNQSGTVTKFQIEQTAPEQHPTLRPHRLGIGFYDFNPQQKLVQKEYYTVDIDGSLTTLALKNFQPPALILLNDADLTYAKTILDSKSLTTALESVEKISDSLARSLVLNALYDMVLNTNNVQTIETTDTTDTTTDNSLSIGDNSSNTTNLTPQQYLKMVFRALPTETSPAIIRQLILNIQQVLNLFTPNQQRKAGYIQAAEVFWSCAQLAPSPDIRLQLVQAFTQVAASPEQAEIIRQIQQGQAIEVELDLEMRWNLLTGLIGAGAAGTKEISDLHSQDQSAFGDAAAAKLQAQIDNQDNKNSVVEQLFSSTDFSNSIVRAMVQGFQLSKDVNSFAGTAQKYFDQILDIWQTRDFQNAETLAKQLYPFQSVTPETLQLGETWLLEHPTAPRALVRLIEENVFITRRALKVQASRQPQ